MPKKAVWISIGIAVLLIGILLFASPLKRKHWPSHFGNFNSIRIQDNGIIASDDLTITLRTEYSDPTAIITNGESQKMPEDYGPNRWCFNYRDSLYGAGGHWKYNRNHDHKYTLSFHRDQNGIFCIMDIQGEDAVIDTVQLTVDCTSRVCCGSE